MFREIIAICGLLFLVVGVDGRFDYFPAKTDEFVHADDWGHLDNCGDPQHNFTFQWHPKKFAAGDIIFLTLDLVAQSTIIQATAFVTVWAKGIPEPIVKTNVQITCAQITKYLPKYAKYCPLKKGDHITEKDVPAPIPEKYPIPAGTYILQLVLHDQDGLPIVCAKGQVQILDPPPVDWNNWRR